MITIGEVRTQSHWCVQVNKDLQAGTYRVGEYELTREELYELHRVIGLALKLVVKKRMCDEAPVCTCQKPETG